MKYTVELSVRARGIQLLKLTEEERDELMSEDPNEVYMDWVEKKDYDFAVEGYYLTYGVDRYTLTIKDEDGEEVYCSDDFNDLPDRTYNGERGGELSDWEFTGVEDGDYLVRLQTIKGCEFQGEFELDEEFDSDRLYTVRDRQINDGLANEDVFPANEIYYMHNTKPHLNDDRIELEFLSDCGEQYWDTHLLNVKCGDEWESLQD